MTYLIGDGGEVREVEVGAGTPADYARAGLAAGCAPRSYGTDWVILEAESPETALERARAWDAQPDGSRGFELEGFVAMVRHVSCAHREGDGAATPAELDETAPGDECPACGCTLGADGYWYVEASEAPRADEEAGS